jgi:hypothetical protein
MIDGLIPLMVAAATGRSAIVDILVADERVREHINDADNWQDTSLHHAYQSKFISLILFLSVFIICLF